VAKGRVRIVERLEVLKSTRFAAYHVQVLVSQTLVERIRREGIPVEMKENDTFTIVTADDDVVGRIWTGHGLGLEYAR